MISACDVVSGHTPICTDGVTSDVFSFVSAALRGNETAEWGFQSRTVNLFTALVVVHELVANITSAEISTFIVRTFEFTATLVCLGAFVDIFTAHLISFKFESCSAIAVKASCGVVTYVFTTRVTQATFVEIFTEKFAILLQAESLFTCAVIASRGVDTQTICEIAASIVCLTFIDVNAGFGVISEVETRPAAALNFQVTQVITNLWTAAIIKLTQIRQGTDSGVNKHFTQG